MKTTAHVSAQHIHHTHSAQQQRAAGMITGLRALGTKEANALAEQLVAKLEATGKEATAAHEALDQRKVLKASAKATSANLKASVTGVYALLAADPALAALLPVREDLASLDDDTIARRVSEAIGTQNKRGAAVAELLVKTADAAREATGALQKAVDGEDAVRQGHAALTELSMMLLQGVALIRRTGKPGSPAWEVLKRKKKHAKPAASPETAPPASPSKAQPQAPAPVAVTPLTNGVHA